MTSVTPDFVRELIDFAPTEEQKSKGFAEIQLEGTVAIFNMLMRNNCAYLADEVGMGKTYVALGVMSLMRYLNPSARIVVVTPRENIQRKWVKELHNFVRNNWKVVANRVKGIQGGPTREPVISDSLLHFVRECLLDADRDFFLRMPSFSVALTDPKRRDRLRKEFLRWMGWVGKRAIPTHREEVFRDAFGAALNAGIPELDLLVIDEAHNLKHGFGPRVSTRNHMLAMCFGHPAGKCVERPWYGPRAKRVLLLSATPFEDDYAAIRRQFTIFGMGHVQLCDAQGKHPLPMALLENKDATLDEKRQVLGRLMVRRVMQLRIAGQTYTKNMYRREWRQGGYEAHDQPMAIEDPKQRLIIGLMQKKVAEVLQDERFNNHFQIGMLSSFESFLESVKTVEKRQVPNESTEEEAEPVFDGNQEATDIEKKGIDSDAINHMVDSYRKRFGASLPHPKLDATANALSEVFTSGEKSLIFVRRVATVDELAAKLDGRFDEWLRARMEQAVPSLVGEIAELFNDYSRARRKRPDERLERQEHDEQEPDTEDITEELQYIDQEDKGSAETFFAWFFRGEGPKGYLSGASFHRDRLSAAGAVYSTLFEDDHVSWLLGYPAQPMQELARALGLAPNVLRTRLRDHAYGNFLSRKHTADRYPRLYVFEAYQVATLDLLGELNDSLGDHARITLSLRYPGAVRPLELAPSGFPEPEDAIGIETFFTLLAKRPGLRKKIWPEENEIAFERYFRRREQRRELISALSRLGASYIDLYLLAINRLGSFLVTKAKDMRTEHRDLAAAFVDLLEQQMTIPGFHSYYELSHVAEVFDLLVANNFHEVPEAELPELAKIYGATLQRQVPIGRMAGGINKRLVRQFRMPGFPLVLVTTSVLQEGEDLHTFCSNIIHYGIAWTPSAIEQRTGRIDRIGSLVQRRLDGQEILPTKDKFIQVFYPYLQDTVEVLQVRRVLKRVNLFLELMHHQEKVDTDSRLDTAREILSELTDIPTIEGVLRSAFPVQEEWLQGRRGMVKAKPVDLTAHLGHFEALWARFVGSVAIEEIRSGSPTIRKGYVVVDDGKLLSALPTSAVYDKEQFRVELRSHASGDEVFLRCISEVLTIDHTDRYLMEAMQALQCELGYERFCLHPSTRSHEDLLTIERDALLDPKTMQYEEFAWTIQRTVLAASHVRARLNVA